LQPLATYELLVQGIEGVYNSTGAWFLEVAQHQKNKQSKVLQELLTVQCHANHTKTGPSQNSTISNYCTDDFYLIFCINDVVASLLELTLDDEPS